MRLNPHFKLEPSFVAILIATVLYTFFMAVVETSPIVFEGDILLEEGTKKLETSSSYSQTDDNTRTKRAATARKERLWDFGVIPYVIDENAGFDSSQKAGSRAAMDYWEIVSCIKFVKRNASEHDQFIRFTVSTTCGCCSYVGKLSQFVEVDGGQEVILNEGCHTKGIILHELGHAIGFDHEHVRPDRDKFIEIQKKNISPGHEHNFYKLFPWEVNSLGEPYDFDSIMHYLPYSASIDPYDSKKPTLQAKRGKNGQIPKFGRSDSLSPGDIRQTNKLYKCPLCGRTFHDQEATFTSPTDHTTYEKPLRCEWYISVTHGAKILLRINIDIICSTNRESNYIEFHDGYWHKSPKLGRFCGNYTNISIMSTGNHMLINYVTDNRNSPGFGARYDTIN